jgi:Uri superfamily endonuclease
LSAKGTYVLILDLKKGLRLRIGKLGRFDFKRGTYAYVGSAFGPGGLNARLKHHRVPSASPHWHIDYLRRAATLRDIWVSATPQRSEHTWTKRLLSLNASQCPVKGFGSSDCRCFSHLVYFKRKPSSVRISRVLAGAVRQEGSSKR